ncbi:nucleoporin NDC1-like [Liolophura sinensis]|uniref:nucleoporin NDC1-like n=1 Tax=Liolophura sinensis TaxID=3198878 RepID=UPI0031585899
MESLETWFRREVYHWRIGASVVWTVLSVPAFFTVYLLMACFVPLHPIQWISDVVFNLTSLSFWGTMVTVMIILGGVSVYNSTHFTVVADVPLTRLAALGRLVKVPSILHGAVFSLASGMIAWSCTGLIGDTYGKLSEKCSEESEKNCFNEKHVFVVCHGLLVGFMFHLLFRLQQENFVQFPLLQQAKFFQVKSNLWPMMEKSLLFNLKFVNVLFYLLYFLLGHIPRHWFLRNLYLEARPEPALNTIFGMMDLGLLWQVTLSGTLVHALLSYATFLFKVYNTEPFVFPVETMYEEYKNKCLHNALGCSQFPLVKYLGFLDLHLLTKHTPNRRRQLFTLSQPGGHPHNWNSVYRACILEIDSLTKSLEENNWKAFAAPPLNNSSGDNSSKGALGVSSLTFRGSGPSVTDTSSIKQQQNPPQEDPLKKLFDTLKKKPVLKYMLGDLPEASAHRLFSTAQTQIWAIQALAAIVANSYSEDLYGVVQKSLPDILRSLLNLQENVEKHFKLAPVVGRRAQNSCAPSDIGLRHSLRTSLKMSLYRIINTFGSHLSEIKLAPEHGKRLKFFMDYKE